MSLAGLNLWGIFVAAIAAFAFGAAWYGALGRQWMAALGKTEADIRRRPMAPTYAATFVAQLLMAVMLAGLIWHMGGATVRTGLVSGALIWLGFVATTIFVNHRFQGAAARLTLIDGGHWLGVLLVQGAVIGAFGPP